MRISRMASASLRTKQISQFCRRVTPANWLKPRTVFEMTAIGLAIGCSFVHDEYGPQGRGGAGITGGAAGADAGAAGAAGEAGAGTGGVAAAGAGGIAGISGFAGSAGIAGIGGATGGTGGATGGTGGGAGAGGGAGIGTGGITGSGGVAGVAGSAGVAGIAGVAGVSGVAGVGGVAGTGGTGGLTGGTGGLTGGTGGETGGTGGVTGGTGGLTGGTGGMTGGTGGVTGGTGGATGGTGGGIVCTPQTYTDTDLTSATPSSEVEISGGSATLRNNESAWIRYGGDVLPDTVGWTENAPLGWAAPPDTTGGILHLTSIGLDTNARYEIDPSFTGDFMVQARVRLINSEGGTGCAIDVANGSYSVILRIQNTQIIEDNTGEFYAMDPTSEYFVYRMVLEGSNYSVLVDNILRLSATAMASPSASHLWIHDIGGTFDSEADWDNVEWYPDSSLPPEPSGTVTSEILDAGDHDSNNIGSGAMLHWSQDTPGTSSITLEFCASNDPTMSSGVNCVSGLTANTGETIPASVVGRYYQWIATLSSDGVNRPTLLDVTLNFETCDPN
jgi:hypothetical protein